jgi:hypothetical protein
MKRSNGLALVEITSSCALVAAIGLWVTSSGDDTGQAQGKGSVDSDLSAGVKKAHYRFTMEDIDPLVTAMSNAGIDNFICWINPTTGALDVVTAIDSKPHLDILPGHCPNNVNVNDPTNDCDDGDDDGDHGGGGDGHGGGGDGHGGGGDGHGGGGGGGGDGGGDGHGGQAAALVAATMHVGLLGNAFDVTQVDIGSVRLSAVSVNLGQTPEIAPIDASFHDVGTPFEGTSCNCTSAGPDGVLDISMHFDWDAVITTFDLQSFPNHTQVPLKSTGMLTNGRAIFGVRDCLRVINN